MSLKIVRSEVDIFDLKFLHSISISHTTIGDSYLEHLITADLQTMTKDSRNSRPICLMHAVIQSTTKPPGQGKFFILQPASGIWIY